MDKNTLANCIPAALIAAGALGSAVYNSHFAPKPEKQPNIVVPVPHIDVHISKQDPDEPLLFVNSDDEGDHGTLNNRAGW